MTENDDLSLISAAFNLSQYFNNLEVDAKSRYRKKLQYLTSINQLPDPYGLKTGWSDALTLWPDVTYGDIYNYLIDAPGEFTKESLKAYKSMESYRLA